MLFGEITLQSGQSVLEVFDNKNLGLYINLVLTYTVSCWHILFIIPEVNVCFLLKQICLYISIKMEASNKPFNE